MKKTSIHKTAIVDVGARIGQGTSIWHWSHICSGAEIGSFCNIGQNVYIANNAVVGNFVKIQNNVSIFDNVTLEDEVFCGPSMVFTNVINPRSKINRKNEYKKTLIRKGATLGANCTIICGNNIGEYSFIGAGSVVTKNVKPYALMVGVPSIQIGWMSKYGEKIPLPLQGEGEWKCPHSNETYHLFRNELKIIN